MTDETVTVREPTRTVLQRETNAIDCEIYALQCQLEVLADRIKTAGPGLRQAAMELAGSRYHVRRFMHEYDRKRT
jgi:hypothetical protein